jgi:6-pyruvoyltetrahydropterin/6-carboxytetrahydropterin synthase
VIDPFDHRSLKEEVPSFRETVPTTENLCLEIFQRLQLFPNAKLESVRIEETSNNSFEYAGDKESQP